MLPHTGGVRERHSSISSQDKPLLIKPTTGIRMVRGQNEFHKCPSKYPWIPDFAAIANKASLRILAV